MSTRKTFADIVSEAENEPARPPDPRSDGVLLAPNGTVFKRVDSELSAEKANELIGIGATVAIDDCGCSGYCSVEWPEPSSVRSVPAIKRARKGNTPFANLEKWRAEDGSTMVMLSGPDFIRHV